MPPGIETVTPRASTKKTAEPTRRVRSATPDTRERAIAEAQRLLLKGGYHAMSLDRIARKIGVRTPSLYHHFPGGKHELFLAVVEHGTEQDGREIVAAMQRQDDSVGKLRAAAQYFATLAGHHPYHAITERRKRLPAATQRQMAEQFAERVEAPLVAVVADAIAAGRFRPCEPVVAVRAFLMLMLSLGEFEASDPMRRTLPDFLVDLFADGLRVR